MKALQDSARKKQDSTIEKPESAAARFSDRRMSDNQAAVAAGTGLSTSENGCREKGDAVY